VATAITTLSIIISRCQPRPQRREAALRDPPAWIL
jgi:hypothetical protein